MRIALIVEGKTEADFVSVLRSYITPALGGHMPKLDPLPCDGLLPTGETLKRLVETLLATDADHVVALTDVYTGTRPPRFTSAEDAKEKMRAWVGNDPRFHPHAAQYEFEAWLLPYWGTIQELTGTTLSAPGGSPEAVNHDNPPSRRMKTAFETGSKRRGYVKTRDALRILRGSAKRENSVQLAIDQCAELKALVNTILTVSGGTPIL